MVADREVHSASAEARSHRFAQPVSSLTLFFLILFCPLQKAAFAQAGETTSGAIGLIRVDRTHVINSFDPDSALGSSLDVLSRMMP